MSSVWETIILRAMKKVPVGGGLLRLRHAGPSTIGRAEGGSIGYHTRIALIVDTSLPLEIHVPLLTPYHKNQNRVYST